MSSPVQVDAVSITSDCIIFHPAGRSSVNRTNWQLYAFEALAVIVGLASVRFLGPLGFVVVLILVAIGLLGFKQSQLDAVRISADGISLSYRKALGGSTDSTPRASIRSLMVTAFGETSLHLFADTDGGPLAIASVDPRQLDEVAERCGELLGVPWVVAASEHSAGWDETVCFDPKDRTVSVVVPNDDKTQRIVTKLGPFEDVRLLIAQAETEGERFDPGGEAPPYWEYTYVIEFEMAHGYRSIIGYFCENEPAPTASSRAKRDSEWCASFYRKILQPPAKWI